MNKHLMLLTNLLLLTGYASGQLIFESPLSNGEFRKLNKMDIVVNGVKIFDNTRLFYVSHDSIFAAVPHFDGQYFTSDHSLVKFSMKDIEVAMLRNKKKCNLYSIIGGLALGTASYFLAKEIFYRPKERLSLTIMGLVGQNYQSAVWEPYFAATVGLGVGVILGTSLSESKVFPSKDPRQSYWKLRTMSHNKPKG